VLRWGVNGECWFVKGRGKKTNGGNRATRYAWDPEDVERDLRKYSRGGGISASEPRVNISTATLRRWGHETQNVLTEDTNDEDRLSVSLNNLRRSWAQCHLAKENRDVRTMMSIRGWSSYSAT
jgi:hypothetical protein